MPLFSMAEHADYTALVCRMLSSVVLLNRWYPPHEITVDADKTRLGLKGASATLRDYKLRC